jgi:ornithine carbamoyltransferase
MGQEEESKVREAAFSGYQVNEEMFAGAAADAIFMHCLPAHRGSEVSAGLMESPRSIVFEQAENRLHVQKAILLTLLN